jgi:hypothetical protein
VTPVVVSCDLESAQIFIADRAARTARETYGAPFDRSARSFAFAAHDDAQGPPLAVLLMTIAGGVATMDELIVEAPERDAGDAATLLIRRFEETASYHNCHKACARVTSDGSTAGSLARAGFRVSAVLRRHYFQTDFVELVKWLQ